MIKKTNREMRVEGNIPDILTDLTLVVREIREILVNQADVPEEEARKMVEHSVELAFKSFDEIKKEAMDLLEKKLEENPMEAFEEFKKVFLGREDGANHE